MKKIIALIAVLTVLIAMAMPMAFGVSANTIEGNEDDITTTTTTAVACYATQVAYDNTAMSIGETRAVRVYHPATNTAAGMTVDEISETISVTYDADGDMLYITALAAGEATLYVREKNCAFGAYVYLTVTEGQTDGCGPMLGDVDEDGILSTADARLVLQYTIGNTALLSEHLEYLFDFNDDGTISTADARDILIATL